MAVNLEAALDELYAAKPEDFVAVRKALVKKLGGKPGAVALKQRRKPTQTAYALNQLARRHPDAIEELVDAGRALVRAQRKALRGDAADVREAIARQRTVIRERMADVAKLVGELGVDAAHLPEIASALQAALVDPAIGEELEAGRLEKPPEAPSSFPLFAGVPARPAKTAKTAKPDRETKAAKAAEKKQADAAEARAKADAAAKREAQKKAQAEAERLESIAASLAADAKKAARAAEEAAKAAAAARKRADAA